MAGCFLEMQLTERAKEEPCTPNYFSRIDKNRNKPLSTPLREEGRLLQFANIYSAFSFYKNAKHHM